jgi:hypothetical protein
MGRKAAAEIEKNPKIKFLDGSKDPAAKVLLDKLNAMAEGLGKISPRPLIKYKVKVIDDKKLNAFTLPDGHIYLYRGLIEATGSDDELAAVLAHEIAHNSLMHVTRAQQKSKPLSWVGLAAIAAALAGGKAGADVMQMTPYVLTGIMNSYSVEYEKEADREAIRTMAKTKFNPSALVSFMNRLSEEERRRPEIELGIFQTHPASPERAAAALAAIEQAGLEFRPRDVEGIKLATVVEEKDRVAVKFGAVTLLEFALPPAGATDVKPTAKERADAVAKQVNVLLRANLRWHELTVRNDVTGAHLLARGDEIAWATPIDAKLQNTTPIALAQKWRDNFGRVFWRETINGGL